MKIWLSLIFVLIANISIAAEPISKNDAIEIAKKSLIVEYRNKYTRITIVEWKEHTKSWMVAFEHSDKNKEEGVWVLVSTFGEVVDAGKVYATH